MRTPTMLHRLAAEFVGTFWLVFGGCGSAVFAAKYISDDGVSLGIGFVGVSLAFGLTVLTGVYAFGTISGGHFNPAVTLGAAIAKRVEWRVLPAYWITQVVGGLLAGLTIYVIASGKPGWNGTGNMAANGYGAHSPGGFSLWAVLVAEVIKVLQQSIFTPTVQLVKVNIENLIDKEYLARHAQDRDLYLYVA